MELANNIPFRNSNIIQFPARGPFAVRVMREGKAWLVVCRQHSWLHGCQREAMLEARSLAWQFGVAVEVA